MLKLYLQFFGGRGASSSSGSGGGGGATAPVNASSNDDAQADTTTLAQPMGASYDSFMLMTDDEKADYIDAATSQGVPDFLANNDFQKFIYNSKMNDKPQLVDDTTLDTMNGTEVFRTVNNVYNAKYDISYTADQIAAQVMKGSVTRVSDSGGSVYGRGLYFADSYSSSAGVYGNRTGDVRRTAVMRGKLNSNAKIISHSQASNGLSSEIGKRTKLGRSLAKMDHDSAVSMWALSKGYNVISSGHGYLNVLNRNALTMSSDIKAAGSRWK